MRAARRAGWRGHVASLAGAGLLGTPASALDEIPLAPMVDRIGTNVRLVASSQGLEVPVDGQTRLLLPLPGAEELEVEARVEGLMLLTWASEADGEVRVFGPPWRYRSLGNGPVGLRLDLRQTAGWRPGSHPALLLWGTGRLVLARLRAGFTPPDFETARAGYDRALRWAPESVGHSTINSLTVPMWSASRGFSWAGALAWFFGASLALGVGLGVWRRRAVPVRRAVAAACLATVAVWDVGFLARVLPIVDASIRLDPEERIRRNHRLAPEVGELAALARATLGPAERVGVMAPRVDWFSTRVLCFNLAPRRCVAIEPGAPEYAGLSKVARLRPDQIDAVVAIHAEEPLPSGFAPVADVSPRAYVARRR